MKEVTARQRSRSSSSHTRLGKTVSNSLPIHRPKPKMHHEREKSSVQRSRHTERLFCVDGERKAKCASSLRLLSPQPKSLAERRQSRRRGRAGARRTRKREEGAGRGLGKEAAARAQRDTATEEAIVPPVLRGGSVTGCDRLGEARPRRGGSAVERGQADHGGEDSSFEPAAAAAPPLWAPNTDALAWRRPPGSRRKSCGSRARLCW